MYATISSRWKVSSHNDALLWRSYARSQGKRKEESRKRTILVTSFGIMLLFLLAGCDGGPTVHRDPVPIPVVHFRHRGLVSIDACVNTTSTYPASLLHQALGLITSSVSAMVQPNWDGANVYVNSLADPTAASATVALHIPAIPDYPPSPTVQATPTTNPNNPYASSPAQATVAATNASTISAYNQQVQTVEQQLSTAKATVSSWAQHLMSMPSTQGVGPADLDQCIELASHRFNNYPGEKWLVIVSSLPLPGNTHNWYPLAGVHVRWIFTTCPTVASCQAGEDAWAQVLTAAGVGWHDHIWYDPAESETLSALFGVPVAS